jgi:tetratricopeptide (TPR) repeat protein
MKANLLKTPILLPLLLSFACLPPSLVSPNPSSTLPSTPPSNESESFSPRAVSAYLRAQVALKQGDLKVARSALEEVVTLDPKASLPRLKLIGILILENDMESARKIFFSGPMNPGLLATPLLKLYIFWAIQDLKKEEALFGLKTLAQRKEGSLVLLLYSFLRFDPPPSMTEVTPLFQGTEEVNLFSDCLKGHLAFLTSNDPDPSSLTTCFEHFPQWLPSALELAYLNEQKGDKKTALLWYRRLNLLDPTLEFSAERIKALESNPNPSPAQRETVLSEIRYTGYLFLVDQLLKENEPQFALSLLSELSPPLRDHPRVLFVEALIRKEVAPRYDFLAVMRKIYPNATKELRRFIALSVLRSLREEKGDQWEKAWRDFFPEYERDSTLYYAYLRGKSDEDGKPSLDLWEKAVERFPEDTVLLYDLGVMYEKEKERNKALEMMQRIIAIAPWHADALNFLGYSWAEEGKNLSQARRLIETALSLKPYAGYIMDSMGWVLFQEGRAEEAIPWLKKAVEREGPDPVILEHLGDAYAVLGKDEEARESYRKALENLEEGKTEEEKRLLDKIQKTYDRRL